MVKKANKFLLFLSVRYLILLLLAVVGTYLIGIIFTIPTLYASAGMLNLFYHHSVFITSANSFALLGEPINLIPACIGISAYLFLLLLNLSSPMGLKTRIKSFVFIIGSFFVINVVRIALFSSLAVSGWAYFDVAHKSIWYLGSTFLLLIIWFVNVYLFNIKSIPLYTDIKTLIKHIRN